MYWCWWMLSAPSTVTSCVIPARSKSAWSVFSFWVLKCRIYADCGVSQTPKRKIHERRLVCFFIGIARIFWLCYIYCDFSTIKKLKNEWIAARRWFLVAALKLCSSSSHWRKRSINFQSILAIVSFSGERFSWSLQYLKNKENELPCTKMA